jgi:membrane protein DedA with SNARE-associated domain
MYVLSLALLGGNVPDILLLYEVLYWIGFLASAVIGNPIPEEMMITLGGIRAAQLVRFGPWHWLLLPACLLGALLADLVLYALGRTLGARLLDSNWLQRLAPPSRQQRLRGYFQKHGVFIFVIGRLVPGIRNTLFLTAGSMRLGLLRFCIADGIGALLGTVLFFGLGYALGAQFESLVRAVEEQISTYRWMVLATLIGVGAGYLGLSALRSDASQNLSQDTSG